MGLKDPSSSGTCAPINHLTQWFDTKVSKIDVILLFTGTNKIKDEFDFVCVYFNFSNV